MGRYLAIATRCQLLTGSYDGASRSCACLAAKYCKLTAEKREYLRTHPSVVKAKERNLEEWEQRQATKNNVM